MEEKKTISFGFSKRSDDKKVIQPQQLDTDADLTSPDFITSLEDKEVKSVHPKEGKKELIIPLIATNNWKTKHENKETKEKPPPSKQSEDEKDDIEKQAMKEILDDTAKCNESWAERGTDNRSFNIPLLMQNKVPEGFETDDKLDVSLRPDEPEDADYDEIPIEKYGLALLRGMGWKQGEGIGKNNKNVAPVEAVLRPKGMGLGADRKQAQALNQSKQGGGKTDGDGKEEHLTMKKGAFCLIEKGPNRDLYGVVEGIDEDNARLMVKLTISGKAISVSQYITKIVPEKEYNKYSKYINKGAADRYKEKEDEKKDRRNAERCKDKSDRDREESRRSDRDREESCRSDRDREESRRSEDRHKKDTDREYSDKSRKRKHEDTKSSNRGSSSSHSNGSSRLESLWVRPDLRVRIVDTKFKKGQYYGEKVKIVDVADHQHCVCQTDQGKCLEDVSQSMVETVIPKSESSYVAIVSGKYKGQLAHVLERDKSKCVATLQLLSDRDRVLKLDYDCICEYVGNIDDEFDF